jgi:hypothetical protein
MERERVGCWGGGGGGGSELHRSRNVAILRVDTYQPSSTFHDLPMSIRPPPRSWGNSSVHLHRHHTYTVGEIPRRRIRAGKWSGVADMPSYVEHELQYSMKS